MPYLGNQSLWYDETFTNAIVHVPALHDVWTAVRSTEGTPPLYYALTWGFGKLFGLHSDAALRATAAIAGIASVPAAFAALRRFTGDRAALAAAAIVAASPMLVWYSLDARAYSLVVLLVLLSIWALALLLERPTTPRYSAWALAAAAAVWTHYFAAFVVAAEVAVLLWRAAARRERTLPRIWRQTAVSMTQPLAWSAVVAALAAPLVILLAHQTDARTDHIGSLSLGGRIGQAGRQLAMGPNVPRAWLEAAGLALAAAGLAAGALAARRSPPLKVTLALAAIAIGLPLALSVTGIEDRLLARNLLVALPFLAALVAVGLTQLRAVPLALYLALAVTTVVWVEGDWRYQNPDWRGAARVLEPRIPRAVVAVEPNIDRQVAARYLDRHFVTDRIAGPETIWVAIAPARADRRDLAAVRRGPTVPRGFVRGAEIEHRGFRLVELRALRPTPALPAAALGRDILGNVPSLLVPEPRRGG